MFACGRFVVAVVVVAAVRFVVLVVFVFVVLFVAAFAAVVSVVVVLVVVVGCVFVLLVFVVFAVPCFLVSSLVLVPSPFVCPLLSLFLFCFCRSCCVCCRLSLCSLYSGFCFGQQAVDFAHPLGRLEVVVSFFA